ncbi:putative serine/threonine-protein kinase drkA [Phytophthora citrophthora]|uniref:Serine/threonine-protein kinase drkA n=1 Tax=Phytophthora citrophthora TaxID=4793 RepID=A0AAD9LI10_9STRA|nr:putative serine/threonine-protein kinase drkA [Phytophthora citrophthora]
MSSSSSDSMSFDGSSSDIARQLYYQRKTEEEVDQVKLVAVPDAVQKRLKGLKLDWTKLPGLAQRALLWDTGFGITSKDTAVQFWTLGKHLMTDLALTLEEFQDAGCLALNCTQPTGGLAYANQFCNGAQMNNAAKCVVEEFEDDVTYHAAMWGIGGNPSTAPVPRVAKHSWTDQNVSYVVMAVHTVSLTNEPGYGECAKSTENGAYGSLVFPCHTTANITDEVKAEMQVVTGSDWVSKWLVEDYPEAAIAGTEFNKLLLVPIAGGAVFVIALIAISIFCMCKRRRKAQTPTTASPAPYQLTVTSPPGCHQRNYHYRPTVATSEDLGSSFNPRPSIGMNDSLSSATSLQFPQRLSHEYGSNSTLKLLLTSGVLAGKRIPLDELKLEKVMSKGASGEVWMCQYGGQQVAVKRLLHAKSNKADEVQEFAEEIELNASLNHPNIGRFIGVSWSSLNNLSMVVEYFPLGDLQHYLKAHGDLLSWAREKIHMAVGVARALEYLHTRRTPIIHRDLKSRNVLLTRQLEPKVIDFGVSKGRLDLTMTAGVGTPYWTAPEVMEGKRYTEQADIYSFGVLLSEMDTCKIPFHDILTSEGKKEKPFRILQMVMSGHLRPSFSDDCPSRIRRVGVTCCQHDPARRPNASALVKMLKGD